jgi:hypothetical protein
MEQLYSTPLDQSRKEFRLLRLLPHSTGHTGTLGHNLGSFIGLSKKEPISCLLEKASLNDYQPYTALSYTWGDAQSTKQIRVNGILLDVTENLEIALQHLHPGNDTLTLWVDAICINQRDADEKNWQVGQMKEVYQTARQVLVWLGPAADGSDEVVHYLDLIGRVWERHELSGVGSAELLALVRDKESKQNVLIKQRLQEAFNDLDPLFPSQFPTAQYHVFCRRGWWYRAWVIQELCVAQDPVFKCGQRCISVNHLKNAKSFLLSYGWWKIHNMHHMEHASEERSSLSFNAYAGVLGTSGVDTMLSFWRQYQKHEDSTLYSLLHTLCANTDNTRILATDQRDLVFSLLGIVSDKDDLEKAGLSVDYHLPTRGVYINTSKALLKRGHLELLSLRQANRNHPDLPSWVCEWSAEVYWAFGDSTNVDKPFQASGTSIPHLVIESSDNQDILKIQGTLVENIEKVASLKERVVDPNKPKAPDWNAVDVFVSETERMCMENPYSEEDIATILLGGLEYYGGDDDSTLIQRRRVTPRAPERYRAMKKWLKIGCSLDYMNNHPLEFVNGRAINQELYEIRQAKMAQLTRDMEEMQLLQPANSVFWNSLEGSVNRVPFRSAGKGYVGLGPKEVKPGDIICLFSGSYLPHVIRATEGGRYELIGEAYVHGIMDGELMEGENTRIDIELC